MHRSRSSLSRRRDDLETRSDSDNSRLRNTRVSPSNRYRRGRREYSQNRSVYKQTPYEKTVAYQKAIQHRRKESPERSYTPAPVSAASQHEGSESIQVLSRALLEGMNKIASNSNFRAPGLIDNSIIKEFNPINDNIVDWLSAIDEYAQINNWSDQITCHLALGKLRGPAETWYRGLPTRLFTWPEWKSLLVSNFIPKRDLHSDMTKMVNCAPKSGQSLYEYAFEKLSLINKMKIPLTDEDKVNLIMGGIKNEQIRFSVETSEITNPAKLIGFLKVFDQKNKYLNENPFISKANIPIGKNQPGLSQKNSMFVKRCYRCQQKGHFKSECREKKYVSKDIVPYNNDTRL